jgi:thiol-disulfide isomerase/thioredoxin
MKRLAMMFFAVVLFGCYPVTAQPPIASGEIGSAMPSFQAKDLNGNTFASTDLKNKVTIINFWATWCPPCRKEMPGFESLSQRYKNQGLEVIGFKSSMMTDTEDPTQFLKEAGVHYRIIASSEDIEKKFGGLQGLPTTLIYDRKGILKSKVIGFEYTEKIEATIQTLLPSD